MALLTVAELRSLVPGDIELEDAALQLLLDAAEQAITAEIGALGETTTYHDGGGSLLLLDRPTTADAIDSITESFDSESPTLLATDDWRIEADGRFLVRLLTGTNPSSWWAGPVRVVATPTSDLALRKGVQAELVKLELASNPGLAMIQVGNWMEQYSQGRPYGEMRTDILATLHPAWTFA
jgi:hypothetical protein